MKVEDVVKQLEDERKKKIEEFKKRREWIANEGQLHDALRLADDILKYLETP